MKKGEVNVGFKTLPGKAITRLELGGALGSNLIVLKRVVDAMRDKTVRSGTVKDKIFASAGNEVKGYTKKGKLFLSFDTNLTEPVSAMSITGNDLLVTGKHIYNHYRDCKDTNYYLSEDVIGDVLALPGEKVMNV